MKRIYLVHRDAAFGMRLCAAFGHGDAQVEVFRSADLALTALHRRPPDALILDISDDALDGIRVMQTVRAASMLPVVLITSDPEEVDLIMGLRLGADAVLRQNSSTHLLLEWVRSLIRRHQEMIGAGGNGKMIDKTFKSADLVMEPSRLMASWRDAEIPLTLSEFKLLYALASRPGVVKSREFLIELIHDNTDDVCERTVDSHIKRLRAKLREVDPAFNGIRTVYGMGYRFTERVAARKPATAAFPMRAHDDRSSLAEARAIN